MKRILHSRPTQRRACDSFMRRRRRAIARDCDWHKLRQRLCGWPRSRPNSRLLRRPTKRPAVRRGGCSRLGESAGSCNGRSFQMRAALR